MSDQLDQVLANISYYRPSAEVQADIAAMRVRFKETAKAIDEVALDGRDKALAFTALENACQAAVAAIARTRGELQPDLA